MLVLTLRMRSRSLLSWTCGLRICPSRPSITCGRLCRVLRMRQESRSTTMSAGWMMFSHSTWCRIHFKDSPTTCYGRSSSPCTPLIRSPDIAVESHSHLRKLFHLFIHDRSLSLWYLVCLTRSRSRKVNWCIQSLYYLTLKQPAGAQSGVQVSQQAKDAFADLKEGRKHKYVIFNLSPDNREVEVLKASSSPDYDEFLKDLPEDQCRWAVYDLEFEKPDGGRRTKLCFFSW